MRKRNMLVLCLHHCVQGVTERLKIKVPFVDWVMLVSVGEHVGRSSIALVRRCAGDGHEVDAVPVAFPVRQIVTLHMRTVKDRHIYIISN